MNRRDRKRMKKTDPYAYIAYQEQYIQQLKKELDRTYVEGYRQAIDDADAYFTPLTQLVDEMNTVTGVLAGIVTSHPTHQKLPCDQLEYLSEELGTLLNQFDIQNEKTIAHWGGSGGDVSVFHAIRKAVVQYIARGDNNETLRELVTSQKTLPLANMLEQAKKHEIGGRPKGMASWRRDIAEKWLQIEAENPGVEAYNVLKQIFEPLDAKSKASRSIEEEKQYRSLKRAKDQEISGISDYRRNLIRDYKKNQSG